MKRTGHIINIISYSLMLLMLTACGFHLKGTMPQDGKNSLSALNILGANRYDDIAAYVKQLAEARDLKISPDAEWSISMKDEKLERWQASTTQSAGVSEFTLRLHTTLYIHHKGITYQAIELAEEAIFQNNADAASSKSNEQEIIVSELRQKLAEDILQRVQIMANNPPDCDSNEPKPATAP